MYISTGQYKDISLRILYTWRLSVQVGISRYLSGCTIAWHLMIWSVLPCTMSWRPPNKASKDKDVLVRTGTYQYILVCTGTYWYIKVWTGMYLYILVCTGMYWYVLVQTSMYWYVLVCTGMYLLVWTQGFMLCTETLPCRHHLPTMQAGRMGIPIPVQKKMNFSKQAWRCWHGRGNRQIYGRHGESSEKPELLDTWVGRCCTKNGRPSFQRQPEFPLG